MCYLHLPRENGNERKLESFPEILALASPLPDTLHNLDIWGQFETRGPGARSALVSEFWGGACGREPALRLFPKRGNRPKATKSEERPTGGSPPPAPPHHFPPQPRPRGSGKGSACRACGRRGRRCTLRVAAGGRAGPSGSTLWTDVPARADVAAWQTPGRCGESV